MKYKINKFPILIAATPRSGSSSLLSLISIVYNIQKFNEPNFSFIGWRSQLTNLMNRGIPFVVKLMPLYVSLLKNIENYYIIKLSRKNHIDQCVSWYIATKLNIWHRKRKERNEFYVDIDNDLIKESIRLIKHQRSLFDNLPIISDLNLFYEDLDLSESENIKNPLPSNIDDIRQAVINFYDNVTF